MDTLFWWTGACVWAFILVACGLAVLAILYEMLGATIMFWRIYRAVKRAGIKPGAFWVNVRIWWRLTLGFYGHKTWTIKNTCEKVKWPRPWYRAKDDKEWLPA